MAAPSALPLLMLLWDNSYACGGAVEVLCLYQL